MFYNILLEEVHVYVRNSTLRCLQCLASVTTEQEVNWYNVFWVVASQLPEYSGSFLGC